MEEMSIPSLPVSVQVPQRGPRALSQSSKTNNLPHWDISDLLCNKKINPWWLIHLNNQPQVSDYLFSQYSLSQKQTVLAR